MSSQPITLLQQINMRIHLPTYVLHYAFLIASDKMLVPKNLSEGTVKLQRIAMSSIVAPFV